VVSTRHDPPVFARLAGHPLRWRLLTELADSDLRVRELATLVGEPQNLVSYHLRLLRDGGLVTANRSGFDGRDFYYHLDLDRCAVLLAAIGSALHPALSQPPPAARSAPAVTVLFVCTGNSARSPIAEALLRRHGAGRVDAVSAGTVPKPHLHPHTSRVLRDGYGVSAPRQRPRGLNTLSGDRFDYLITLCDKAREVCGEVVDHIRRVHWSIRDPADGDDTERADYLAFSRTAAEIDTRVRHLLPVLAADTDKEAQP
jgi:protein-tyrosine-phosphatase